MRLARQEDRRPWYREPWVWLMIAIPLAAVIAGLTTIYIAVTTSDGLVVDDYYKRGKAINRDLARDRAAADHQLEARIEIDTAGNRVNLLLQSRDYVLPAELKLSFLHPTRKGHDQQVLLQQLGAGRYTGQVDELARGSWYLQLEADDWRLSGRVQVPQVNQDILSPLYQGDS